MNTTNNDLVRPLPQGYLKVIETWGSDARIVESARMSTAKGFLGWGPKEDGSAGDEKLLRYLWEHKHSTPFEFAGMTIEVMAPIFVFREWHRHRTQSYNELSARYTPLPDANYVPELGRCMVGADGSNKQAGTIAGAARLTEDAAHDWLNALVDFYDAAEAMYQRGLSIGIPKELARVVVPVGRFSRMRASTDLRNWLAFVTLRSAPSAQWEIRQYSNAVAGALRKAFPRTMEIFDGRQA